MLVITTRHFAQCHRRAAGHALLTVDDDGSDVGPMLLHESPTLRGLLRCHHLDVGWHGQVRGWLGIVECEIQYALQPALRANLRRAFVGVVDRNDRVGRLDQQASLDGFPVCDDEFHWLGFTFLCPIALRTALGHKLSLAGNYLNNTDTRQRHRRQSASAKGRSRR